ncbi:major facilitator superfamily domain-containing protein 4A-like isoform X2 [Littorina saxatilis]|uniref:Uncharacterized protein n=1 Tax=Littorina saxatilis TaxID=31220 RepID=A0AAN9G1S1_9CAEN
MAELNRMLADAEHRSKLYETFWLFWVFVLVGFDNGILGPCLPDLQASVGASLEGMSYVFFVQGTGALLGNVLGFALERRFDRRLLMGIYILLGSATNIAIPLVPKFYYLLGLFLLQGVTKGLADFGAMSLCNILWEKDKALPFQFIVVGAGISTFISPFLAQPFIDDSLLSLPPSVRSSISSESCPGKHISKQNRTQLMTIYEEAKAKFLSNTTQVLTSSSIKYDIRWPFVIVGCVSAPAALAFFYFYVRRRDRVEDEHSVEINVSVDQDSPTNPERQLLRPEKRKTKCDQPNTVLLFRILIIVLNIPVFGLLLTFADLLTTIGMTSPLCMTAVEASYLNTVLWGAAMIGRAVSALTLACVPMFLQLLLCSFALVAMGTVLVASPRSNVVALWFGTAGVGLFATPSMPGFIAWSGDYAPITPFFMNLCLCAAGVGEMLLPFVGGQLMAAFGSPALMLFALVIMIAMLALFLLSHYVARHINL